MIREKMDENLSNQVKEHQMNKFLRNDLKLRYKVFREAPKLGNSSRSLYLRMLFAKKLLDTLGEGMRILNID